MLNRYGILRRWKFRQEFPSLFCESDEPEAMMQACLQIMAPGDRSTSSAEHEMKATSGDRSTSSTEHEMKATSGDRPTSSAEHEMKATSGDRPTSTAKRDTAAGPPYQA